MKPIDLSSVTSANDIHGDDEAETGTLKNMLNGSDSKS
jgi:hypothetical protein